MNPQARAPTNELTRVLLVEDDPLDQRLISDLLDSALGTRFLIDWARTLEEAQDRLQQGRFDVCLLDLHLPDGDGLDLLASVEARGLMLPTIVLSGGASAELDHRAMALGASALIDKNALDGKSLERTIRYGIHQRKMTRGLARSVLEDEATGLISQTLYRDRLERAIAFARRNDRQVAVMLIDLAVLPAAEGRNSEAALAAAGRRLATALRETDTIARIADRRLALLIEGMRRLEHAALVARKILRLLAEAPAEVDGEPPAPAPWTPSIGVAVYPSEGINGDTLMRRADAAMRLAMAEGGGRCRFASERIEHEAREGAILEKAFREALARRDLRLRFHPEMHLTRRGAGLAGDVFWRHPSRSWLPIAAGLAHGEENRSTAEIVDWTLAAAAERLAAWDEAGLKRATLSLTCPFSEPSVLAVLERAIRERIVAEGIAARRLEFDLPERLVLGRGKEGARDLAALKATGVRLSLDGFGSGEATIQKLRLDLMDGLKLAPSLYRHLPGDERSETFLRAIIGLGRDLDLCVTAKGARDQRQFALLKRLGCDAIQLRGVFPPMSARAATSWLRAPYADAPDSVKPRPAAPAPEMLAATRQTKGGVRTGDLPPVPQD